MELAAVCGCERRDKRLLRRFDSLVEAFQGPASGRRQVDEHAALVVLIADARHQTIAFELTQQSMHVTAVNRQAASQFRLAGGAPFGEGAQDDEMLAAQAVARERLRDEVSGRRGELAGQPARQLPHSAGRVIRGSACGLSCHCYVSYVGMPNVDKSNDLGILLG
jgi:hypothetical protein